MASAYFTNSVSDDITDSNNWFSDSSFTTPYGSVPDFANTSVQLGNSLDTISCNMNVTTIGASFVITNNVTVNSSSMVEIVSSGTLQNQGTFYLANSITNNGTYINESIFHINTGTFFNNYANFSNSSGVIYNSGTLTFHEGSSPSFNSALIQNNGTISVAAPLTNSGTIDNSGTFNISGIFTNSATINLVTGTINVANTTFDNTGTLIIGPTGTIISNSLFINSNVITNNGVVAILVGTLENNSGGTITNNNILQVVDRIVLSRTSILINNGTFTFGLRTTRFKGEVYPQVPSSASWGNIFI